MFQIVVMDSPSRVYSSLQNVPPDEAVGLRGEPFSVEDVSFDDEEDLLPCKLKCICSFV
jgi:hypothetical protein